MWDLKHKELQEDRKKKSCSESVMKYIGPSLLRWIIKWWLAHLRLPVIEASLLYKNSIMLSSLEQHTGFNHPPNRNYLALQRDTGRRGVRAHLLRWFKTSLSLASERCIEQRATRGPRQFVLQKVRCDSVRGGCLLFCHLCINSKCGGTPAARCSDAQGWFFCLALIYLCKKKPKKTQINKKKDY